MKNVNKIENVETKNPQRYDNIDLMKIIAIFMVVMLHTLFMCWNTNFLQNESIKTYLKFLLRIICEGVPIFIFVNGFLIINKDLDFKKHLKKILNIFFVLVIWSLVHIVVIKCLNGENIKLKDIIIEIFSVEAGNKYTGSLWFLQSLIMLYLFFPILKVVHDNNKKIYNYFFIIVSIFTVGLKLFASLVSILSCALNINSLQTLVTFVEKYNFVNNGAFIFYFMLGGYVFENKEIFTNRKNRIIAISIAVIGYFIVSTLGILETRITNKMVKNSYNYLSIFMATIIVGLYAITYKYTNKQHFYNKIITSIGKNTLGIYLIHTIFIEIGNKILSNSFIINSLLYPIMIFVLSYLVVIAIKKIPVLKKIVSI